MQPCQVQKNWSVIKEWAEIARLVKRLATNRMVSESSRAEIF